MQLNLVIPGSELEFLGSPTRLLDRADHSDLLFHSQAEGGEVAQ